MNVTFLFGSEMFVVFPAISQSRHVARFPETLAMPTELASAVRSSIVRSLTELAPSNMQVPAAEPHWRVTTLFSLMKVLPLPLPLFVLKPALLPVQMLLTNVFELTVLSVEVTESSRQPTDADALGENCEFSMVFDIVLHVPGTGFSTSPLRKLPSTKRPSITAPCAHANRRAFAVVSPGLVLWI